MARPTTASRRYAEAAFELAQRDDALDTWAKDLATAAELLGDERVARVVDNPARPFAQRRAVIDKLLAKRVSPHAQRLVTLLSERGRLEILPAISMEYDALLKRHRGIVTAIVTTAASLTKDETKAIEQRLREMTGAQVELQTVVDDSLIGGLTVRIGDQLYDSSVRGRLERLRSQLVAGARVGRGA
jgi:F-type H+-transporting ATPase subunit delta